MKITPAITSECYYSMYRGHALSVDFEAKLRSYLRAIEHYCLRLSLSPAELLLARP